MFFSGAAAAQNSGIDELATEQMSVRELMQLDTALALSQSKNKLHHNSKPAPVADTQNVLAQSGGLKLVAIYGVGNKLLAEVRVGSQPYLYMHGRALPVGLKTSTTAYLLRGITGSCVQLERKDDSRTLCLHPSLWAGG